MPVIAAGNIPASGKVLSSRALLYEKFQRDMESGVELLDHGDGEFSFAVEDFGDTGRGTEVGDHVFSFEAVLIHEEEDDVHRVLLGEFVEEGFFPFSDERSDGMEFFPFIRVFLETVLGEFYHSLYGGFVVRFRADSVDGNGVSGDHIGIVFEVFTLMSGAVRVMGNL